MDREKLCQSIFDLIKPITEFQGAELVRVKVIGASARPTIQIMAERPNATMDLELCEILSREYSLLLDVENVVETEYTLEVSSPGIDRPLTRRKDFDRWFGFEATIDVKTKYEGRRKAKGLLQKPLDISDASDDFMVIVHEEQGIFKVPFSVIKEVKLTLSPELLLATEKGAKLHGFAYDTATADQLAEVEIEVNDKEKVKKFARSKRPKKIDEIEEIVTIDSKNLKTEGN